MPTNVAAIVVVTLLTNRAEMAIPSGQTVKVETVSAEHVVKWSVGTNVFTVSTNAFVSSKAEVVEPKKPEREPLGVKDELPLPPDFPTLPK